MIGIAIITLNEKNRLFLETIAQSDPEFQYVGFFSDEGHIMSKLGQLPVHVLLIDIDTDENFDLKSMVRIKDRFPQIKYMACTRFQSKQIALQAIRSGADAYFVFEKSKPYQFIDAIKDVYAGERPISSCIVNNIWTFLNDQFVERQADEGLDIQLSKRQSEIMELLHEGLNYREISKHLFISVYTLKWHIHNIYQKLNAANRTEAINIYFKRKSKQH